MIDPTSFIEEYGNRLASAIEKAENRQTKVRNAAMQTFEPVRYLLAGLAKKTAETMPGAEIRVGEMRVDSEANALEVTYHLLRPGAGTASLEFVVTGGHVIFQGGESWNPNQPDELGRLTAEIVKEALGFFSPK
jgi:hypothetical protein